MTRGKEAQMTNLNSNPEVNICLLTFSALVILFLLIGAVTEPTNKRPFMKSFIHLLASSIIVVLGEIGIWIFQGTPDHLVLLKLCCTMSYGVGTMMVALLTYCLLYFFWEKEKISLLPAHIMLSACSIFFCLIFLSIWNGLIFKVDVQGNVANGPLGFLIYIFDAATFLAEIGIIAYYRRLLSVRGFLVMIGYCTFQLLTMFLVNVWYPAPMYVAATLFLILMFIFFHGELTRRFAEKEKELGESRIAIMVSQIQPHFLYNSLNAIYYLCDKDTELAKKAINDFSEYLRHNLNSLKRTAPVCFEEELQYVKTYLNLEKMRFDEELNVEYHIETTGFLVPALSVQPLVENAIKHGICKKENGGTLRLSSKESEDFFEVTIADDGVGFDPDIKPDDGKLHVGIQNVKQRLHAMCGGTLTIDSRPGEGTIVTIRIPKKKEKTGTAVP